MNERDKVLLKDMLEASKRAQAFIAGKNREDLEKDNALLGFALVRAIKIIGETASKITLETRQTYDDISWHNIIGMRNRIVHNYNNVDYDIVWEITTKNLKTLIPQLEKLLAEKDENL